MCILQLCKFTHTIGVYTRHSMLGKATPGQGGATMYERVNDGYRTKCIILMIKYSYGHEISLFL